MVPTALRISTPTRKQILTDLRRQEILAAAIKVFGKKGFAATCVEDVAVAAKIAKGTVYLYFKSKEDIYATAVQVAIDRLQVLTAERVAGTAGIRDQLSAAIALRMDFWDEQRDLYRLLLTIGSEPQHYRQTRAVRRQGQGSFLSILANAAATGELPAGDYNDIAWAILDMIRGANERRLDRTTERTPREDAEAITGIVFDYLGLEEG
jgi:AcrR family transcriptional regulator